MDTIPFAEPASLEKYEGTNLNIKPLPIPAQILIAKQPIVNRTIWLDKLNISAPIIIITKSMISACTALNLSPITPPTGLKNVASAINIPERIPASTLSILKWSTRKFGKKIPKATKAPKVIKYHKLK